jgi:hypothetical protein
MKMPDSGSADVWVDMQAVALPVCSSFQLLMQGSRHAVLEFVAWE